MEYKLTNSRDEEYVFEGRLLDSTLFYPTTGREGKEMVIRIYRTADAHYMLEKREVENLRVTDTVIFRTASQKQLTQRLAYFTEAEECKQQYIEKIQRLIGKNLVL
ncbi:hypothetical protein [Evansella tamaricis]|uniref:Uncharacterized protein n=1 Tax=Evansella tamaricis TaxID=2069301 RepID=A0ABS6JHI6_9BACI|nr:hypothetical protein [Evansella tamaricis]MBU9712689.1 hypothetical protein [Evansella tamaricis]